MCVDLFYSCVRVVAEFGADSLPFPFYLLVSLIWYPSIPDTGGLWASIALGLLFFLAFFSVVTSCCILPLLVDASAGPASSSSSSSSSSELR